MQVHLIDGTYELFRQHYGQAARHAEIGPYDGVVGVLGSTLQLLGEGATHLAVASDHVIESFRNDLWPGYKSSEGMAAELLEQIPVLEEALVAMGVVTWAMVEYEADDALAAGAAVASADERVERVVICTPDKDLGQCVEGTRVVQLDRRKGEITDAAGVFEKFGVLPESIPDYLAVVGDSADGFPGLAGWGAKSASAVLGRYRHLEDIPRAALDWDIVGLRGADKLSRDAAGRFRAGPAVPADRHGGARGRRRQRRQLALGGSDTGVRGDGRAAGVGIPGRAGRADRRGPALRSDHPPDRRGRR